MNKTNIEWTTMTWNCLRGCSWASPGCDHCYAETIAKRFSKPGLPFHGVADKDGWNSNIEFMEHKLDEPLKKKTPQIIFANSMSDICHPKVKHEWIDAILKIITATPRHFYMMLTKRPNLINQKIASFWTDFALFNGKPITNLAMGTSIESEELLWRGHRLIHNWPGRCFLSIEPLLDRVSIKSLLEAEEGHRIEQVIVGGETGKGARPMRPEWVRQLRDETKEAGRAFFFKQWGSGLYGKRFVEHLNREIDYRQWNESPWPVVLPIKEREIA